MSFVGQLGHEFGEELRLFCELAFDRFELLPARVAGQDGSVILLYECTELLDANQDLDDELGDFGLFTAKHGLIEYLVEELIMDANQILEHLNRRQLLLEALPTSIDCIQHEILLECAHERVHRAPKELNLSDLLLIWAGHPPKLNGIQVFPATFEKQHDLLDLDQREEDSVVLEQALVADHQI